MNYDGTPHDEHNGIPNISNKIKKWLESFGWSGDYKSQSDRGIWCTILLYCVPNAKSLLFECRKEVIMNIVGYTKDGDFIDFLKEATITCSLSELEDIVSFFETAKIICEKQKEKSFCLHFRDSCSSWDSSSSDLIVLKI